MKYILLILIMLPLLSYADGEIEAKGEIVVVDTYHTAEGSFVRFDSIIVPYKGQEELDVMIENIKKYGLSNWFQYYYYKIWRQYKLKQLS